MIDNHAMPVVWVAARHRTPEIAASAKNLPGAFGRLLVLAIAIFFAAPDRTLPPLVTKHDRVVAARRAAQGSRDVFGSFDAAVQYRVQNIRRHALAALKIVAPPQERPPLLAWRVWVVFRTPQFVAAAVSRLRLPLVVAALPLFLFAVAFAVAESAAANALAPKPTGTDDQAVEHGQRAVDYEHAVSAEMGSESVAVSPG